MQEETLQEKSTNDSASVSEAQLQETQESPNDLSSISAIGDDKESNSEEVPVEVHDNLANIETPKESISPEKRGAEIDKVLDGAYKSIPEEYRNEEFLKDYSQICKKFDMPLEAVQASIDLYAKQHQQAQENVVKYITDLRNRTAEELNKFAGGTYAEKMSFKQDVQQGIDTMGRKELIEDLTRVGLINNGEIMSAKVVRMLQMIGKQNREASTIPAGPASESEQLSPVMRALDEERAKFEKMNPQFNKKSNSHPQ